MSAQLTKEQLQEELQKVQYEIMAANRREEILAQKVGQKEREIADLTVRLETVSQGYQSQQQYSSGLKEKLDVAEKEIANRQQRRQHQQNKQKQQ